MAHDPFKNDPFFSDAGFGRMGGGEDIFARANQMMNEMRSGMPSDDMMGKGLSNGHFVKQTMHK